LSVQSIAGLSRSALVQWLYSGTRFVSIELIGQSNYCVQMHVRPAPRFRPLRQKWNRKFLG
jgi:hypothetical protein